MQLPKPPGRSLMSVRGNAAPRGMTAHDRIRLIGPFAEYRQPRPGNTRPGLTILAAADLQGFVLSHAFRKVRENGWAPGTAPAQTPPFKAPARLRSIHASCKAFGPSCAHARGRAPGRRSWVRPVCARWRVTRSQRHSQSPHWNRCRSTPSRLRRSTGPPSAGPFVDGCQRHRNDRGGD